MIDSLSEMSQNQDKQWNRDTIGQEFNLVITQKVLAYTCTSGITTGLQTRGMDLANALDKKSSQLSALYHASDEMWKLFAMMKHVELQESGYQETKNMWKTSALTKYFTARFWIIR